MADLVKFFVGNQENLDNLQKIKGQLVIALDTSNSTSPKGTLYYDYNSAQRVKLSSETAEKAIGDETGLNIRSNYLTSVEGSRNNTLYTITAKSGSGVTKNTFNIPINLVGSSATSSKIFLLGAITQSNDANNSYTNNNFYIENNILNGTFKGNITGKATTAGTADVALSVGWNNISDKPTNSIVSQIYKDTNGLNYKTLNGNITNLGLFAPLDSNSKTIPIEYIPKSAIERLFKVTSLEYLMANVDEFPDLNLGDTILDLSDNIMYYIIGSDLTSADSYQEYSAGIASAVEWSNILNKPTTLVSSFLTSESTTAFTITPRAYTGSNLTAITVPFANTSRAGLITTLAQSFAGNKTFMGDITIGSNTDSGNKTFFMKRKNSSDNSSGTFSVVIGGTANYASIGFQYNKADGTSDDYNLLMSNTNLRPWNNNDYDLGTSSNKFRTVYATTFNGNATSATRATSDSSGNNINTTYVKSVTGASGTGYTITVTKGNGSTSSFTIPLATTGGLGLVSTGSQTFAGDKNFTGTVAFVKTTDASGVSNNYPAVIIGGAATSAHLELDANEIMAKGSANSVVPLYLNNEGGVVDIGPGGMNIRGHIIPNATTRTLDIGSTNNYFRNVYGTNFYGTATNASQLTSNDVLSYTSNTVRYFNIHSPVGTAADANNIPTNTWWHILRFIRADGNKYYTDLAIPFSDNSIYYKRIAGGEVANTSNTALKGWVKVLDEINYTNYTVTKTGSGASGTWGINITGNAATATKLQTARTINGTSFNGTANITTANWGSTRNFYIADASAAHTGSAVSVNGSSNVTLKLPSTITATLSGTASNAHWLIPNNTLTLGASGLQYFNLDGDEGTSPTANNTPTSAWYHILRMNHSNSKGYYADIAVPLNDIDGIYWRQIRSGTNYGWFKLLDSNNYTNYTVTKTGSGASGTWGINVTGNAGTATRLQTARTIRTNLGSTSTASFDGTANITPGITGILAVSHGGTGASSASTARTNLGAAAAEHTHSFMDDITGTVPVSRGGTGAWDAGAACTNLGAVTISTSQSITGAKTFKGSVYIQNSTTGPTISFQSSNTSNVTSRTATIFNNLVSTTGTNNYLYFRLYSRETGGDVTSRYEDYRLPTSTANRTNNGTYEILTSKTKVTVAQGGTGTGIRGAQSGGALANLGCVYSTNEPMSVYEGMIWLKPVT